MVIAPAKTGRDRRSSTAVITTAHLNKGIKSAIIPNDRKFPIVEIKFTAPKIDLAPARWREKIAKSTAPPAWAMFLERGG